MKPFRLADFSKMVEVGEGADNALLYETVLKRAQTELSRKGLYRGEVDGKFSASTKAALTEFQRLAKLQPSGIPDPATLWRSEEHTSELQSLMRISYAVFCLKTTNTNI